MSDSEDSTTSIYFSEVGKHKLPSVAEERMLFTAYKQAQTQAEVGRSARDRAQGARDRVQIGQQIACGYLRFVILQARRRTNDPQLLKDLISQGNIGLMIGIQRFDLKHGVRFLTYAASWINVCMQEHLHKLGVVHVPSHTRKEMRRRRTQENAMMAQGTLSAPTMEEPNTTPIDGVSIAAEDDVEDEATARECNMFDYMEQADLSRNERLVMTYSFGLRGTEFEPVDLVQFLYELDGSLFSVEQIEGVRCRAIEKVRSLMLEKGIESLSDVW